jgi:hypothetical protein
MRISQIAGTCKFSRKIDDIFGALDVVIADCRIEITEAQAGADQKSERGKGQISKVLDEKLVAVTQELRSQELQEFRSYRSSGGAVSAWRLSLFFFD